MKQQFARLLQRFPFLAGWIVRLYRLTQPRYTAGVNGVLLDDAGRVLLVEHVYHPRHPWGLPGGWMGRGENPAEALVREFLEETALRVSVVRPLVIQNGHFWGSHLDIAFLLQSHTPLDQIRLSSELTAYGWYALDALPPLNGFNLVVLAIMNTEVHDGRTYPNHPSNG